MRDHLNAGDASVLAAAIEAQHPDPFRAVSRETLLREVQRVDALDAHDRSVLTVELMRTLALLGPRNGHTAIHPLNDHPITGYAYPIVLYEFDDGVFVIGAGSKDLVGSELIAVDGIDVADVLRAVTPLVSRDNEWTVRARRPTFVVDASVLRGIALVDDDKQATFRLHSRDGAVSELTLEAIPTLQYLGALLAGDFASEVPSPKFLRRRGDLHWVEMAADGRAVHVGYNVTLGNIEEFAREVEMLAAPRRVSVIVLDLRHNFGGDNRTYGPLLKLLERLGNEKRLAVLTSRNTFSAAMQLVVDLEHDTPAVFIGEPTGGSPNSYGDAVAVELPNSGVNAFVATIAWMTAGDSDERLTRKPDIPVVSDSRTFFAGEDPTLDTAVAALS